jgi:hypothetical protein
MTVGKTCALLSTAAVLAAMPAATAPAAPPTDAAQVIEVPAGGVCAFPVRLELQGKAKTIALPGGRSITTSPGLRATVTNLDVPTRSARLAITGSTRSVPQPDGTVVFEATGRNLNFDPVAGFVLVSGRFTYAFRGDELVQPLTGNGRVTDVCALLS